MPNLKAVTFGSAMVDTIAVLQSESIEKISFSNSENQFLLVEPGRKVEAESIATHIGGGGLNTAVCLSRLGCDVMPLVKTGNDQSHNHVHDHCLENKLRTEGIIVAARETTGAAVMIASHEKNAAIFTNRGANTKLVKSDLKLLNSENPKLIHAAGLSGESANMLPEISKFAHRCDAFFSSNPGIRQILNKTNSVLNAAQYMSLISLNALEAAALVPCLSVMHKDLDWGVPDNIEPVLTTTGGSVSLEKFCRVLAEHGPKNILVTYGADGAWLFDGHAMFHRNIIPTHVAGTAGAGDAFVSTLAWGLRSEQGAENALLLAAHNASSVVSYINTTDGLLMKNALYEIAGMEHHFES